MTASGQPGRDLVDEGVVLGGRDPRQVVAQDDRAQVGLERLARLEPPRLVGQPAFDVDVARGVEPADGRQRRLEVDVARASRRRSVPGPAGPTRCCRPRRIARRAGRPAGSPRRGSGTARRGRAPSGTSRSTGSRRPALDRQGQRRGRRRRTRPGRRSAPAARASPRPSPPNRRARRRDPRGSRSASISVTRPLPQPASRTRSSPSSGRRSSTTVPQRVIGAATRS